MTTPANKNSDAGSINWEMMARAEAEGRRRIAAIEANMIWSRIDVLGDPSEFSEEIVEESEIVDDPSEDDNENDEVMSSDDEEFVDDNENDEVISSDDEESGDEEESEEDRFRRQYLELNRYSDSDPE